MLENHATPELRPHKIPGSWNSRFVEQSRTNWAKGLPKWAKLEDEKLPLVIAIGSGKGGVGKSLISANIGADLSRRGYRTLLIDLDLGCANLHTYFGMSHPQKSLETFLQDPMVPLWQLILPGPIKNLGIIAGGRNDERNITQRLTPSILNQLWRGIISCRQEYDIDIVILDLGAGTHTFTMELFSLAHLGMVSVLPEPTSIENAYVFLRSYLIQLITNAGFKVDLQEDAQKLTQILGGMTAKNIDRGYLAAIRSEYETFPELIKALGSVVTARKLGLLVNQAREREDREIGHNMADICRRFFGLQSYDLGYLNYDEAAWRSLRNQRLLVTDFPHSIIAQKIQKSTERLLGLADYE